METRTHYFHESAQKVLSCRERNSWNDEREREREVKNLAIALKKEKKKKECNGKVDSKKYSKVEIWTCVLRYRMACSPVQSQQCGRRTSINRVDTVLMSDYETK